MSKQKPRTFAEVIDCWPPAVIDRHERSNGSKRYAGRIQSFADDMGLVYGAAQAMRVRSSIHPNHWRKVVRAAKARRIPGITLELLAEIAESMVSS